MSLTCVNEADSVASTISTDGSKVVTDSAIFMLQTIELGGQKINLFFDTGCGDLVIKKSAVDILLGLGKAKLEVPGPIVLSGVGNQKSVSDHGIYSISLPMRDGKNAILNGVCLDKVTMAFPKYSLKDVEVDVRNQCRKEGGNSLIERLPKLSRHVGGETDILIGIKYLKYHPRRVWESQDGLSIYDSLFVSADCSTGIIGGPHPKFTEMDRQNKNNHPVLLSTMFSHPLNHLRNLFQASKHVPLLGRKSCLSGSNTISDDDRDISVKLSTFEAIENAGTEILYRCVDCRNCDKCRKGEKSDAISIEEEVEQNLIEQCVNVDIDRGITVAKLPFIYDPDSTLTPNDKLALRIFEGQLRMLARKPDDRRAVIESEGKLQELGYVDYLNNLPKEDQEIILNGKTRYYIPWRTVWNENSLSTPIRLVFDGTACTRDGCSLNGILAKGANLMNRLVDILIRWTSHKWAFHTDIKKMYNSLYLDKSHWRFQLYLWNEYLDLNVPPRVKVLKTPIYGVKSSGNLAECGLRKTAELTKIECPKAFNVINDDIYVDDCFSGDTSEEGVREKTDELCIALSKGGFDLKGFALSKEDPPEHLSHDGKSVLVGGLKWFPKEDTFTVKTSDLNFSRKNRGRKSLQLKGIIPEKITKRDCVGKVAEIHDPLGRVTPLTCSLELDLRDLNVERLDWDDQIPENLMQVWRSNFEMLKQIGNIRLQRAVVPADAVDVSIETIDTGDASHSIACVAIYARFKLKSGGYSCQLVFARSKIIPKDMSIPRAELLAATLNASTGFIVKRAFGNNHKKCYKITDSQVALHWISCSKTKLKTWVRNRVIEINRLVDMDNWGFVDSKNMIADIGTRKGATINDVGPESNWVNGLPWMRGNTDEFPMKSVRELVLGNNALLEAKREYVVHDPMCDDTSKLIGLTYLPTNLIPDAVGYRYKFSKYLIDPNRFRFRKVVRVLGLVFLFLHKLFNRLNRPIKFLAPNGSVSTPKILSCNNDRYIVTSGKRLNKVFESSAGLVVDLSEIMVQSAMCYYFQKATLEIEHFLSENKYKNISEKINGVLFYVGRILPTQEISSEPSLGDACFDLCSASFHVPLIDKFSPIAYAIVNEIHWYHPDVKHGGTESVLRQVQSIAYIIGGRSLVKDVKKACVRCRILFKRAIKIMMGPKNNNNICIAPAFYTAQVDLCGPFDSFSNINKRAKIKIWFVVFCCSATGAVDCKVMEDYSADSFILAFTRFSCRYGYPLKLLIDSGSQLIKGCSEMVLDMSNIKYRLSKEYGVKFDICPVGAHNVHGKVERKIQHIQTSMRKELSNDKLSIIQWETLIQQVSNSINNLPIGLGNRVEDLENLDLITPNRLLLGRNNNRSPTAPLCLSRDTKKIIDKNGKIFSAWFKSWLISYVPTLIERPKWFENDRHLAVGDIVLFLKSEKEFENKYQYGIVSSVSSGKDGHIRTVEVQYKNSNEDTKRTTKRGVRQLVMIHPVEELGLFSELNDAANNNISMLSIIGCTMCNRFE